MATRKAYIVETLDVIAGYGGKEVDKRVTSAESLDNLRRTVLKYDFHTLVAKKFSDNAKTYAAIWIYQILKSSTSTKPAKRLGHIVAGPTSTFTNPVFVWIPNDADYDEGRIINKDGSLGQHPKDRDSFEFWNDKWMR